MKSILRKIVVPVWGICLIGFIFFGYYMMDDTFQEKPLIGSLLITFAFLGLFSLFYSAGFEYTKKDNILTIICILISISILPRNCQHQNELKKIERSEWVNSRPDNYVVIETFYPPFNITQEVYKKYPEFNIKSSKIISSGTYLLGGEYIVYEITLSKR